MWVILVVVEDVVEQFPCDAAQVNSDGPCLAGAKNPTEKTNRANDARQVLAELNGAGPSTGPTTGDSRDDLEDLITTPTTEELMRQKDEETLRLQAQNARLERRLQQMTTKNAVRGPDMGGDGTQGRGGEIYVGNIGGTGNSVLLSGGRHSTIICHTNPNKLGKKARCSITHFMVGGVEVEASGYEAVMKQLRHLVSTQLSASQRTDKWCALPDPGAYVLF